MALYNLYIALFLLCFSLIKQANAEETSYDHSAFNLEGSCDFQIINHSSDSLHINIKNYTYLPRNEEFYDTVLPPNVTINFKLIALVEELLQ